MIYLFDDKESRQQLYGWTDERFGLWSDSIIRIKDFADYLLLDEKNNPLLVLEAKVLYLEKVT